MVCPRAADGAALTCCASIHRGADAFPGPPLCRWDLPCSSIDCPSIPKHLMSKPAIQLFPSKADSSV